MVIDDEILMAYVDGELDGDDAQRVRTQVEHSPELRSRLRVFEESYRMVHAALQEEADVPVPTRFLELLSPASPATAAPSSVGVSWLARWFAAWSSPPSLAVAAALLLCIGVGTGLLAGRLLMSPSDSAGDALLVAEGSTAWNRGFDGTASGETFLLVAGSPSTAVDVTPVATFMDARDRFCRAFRQAGTDNLRREGVVCREPEGTWQAVAIVLERLDAAPSVGGGDYRPASGAGGGALERLIDAYMTTSAFDRAEEQALMEQGWRPPR